MKRIFFSFLILSLLLWVTDRTFLSGYPQNKAKKIVGPSSGGTSENTLRKAKILVGPNILVSRDGDVPHVELMVASNAKDPNNLLGAAITFTRPNGSYACKAYASMDGGYTWTDSAFPEQMEFGGADPQVAFGLHGTAYFAGLSKGLYFYRSEDGGKTWQKPVLLRKKADHPQIIVDQSLGKYAGRIYIGAMYTFPKDSEKVYEVGVFRSEDKGRTFIGPIPAASGGGKKGINVTNMLIFSDGTLFVPYNDFEYDPEKTKTAKTQTFWFVTSSDGGVTFSRPTKIHDQFIENREEFVKDFGTGKFVRRSFPEYAIDAHSKEYRDRLYVVWDDYRFGNTRILFSCSSDEGKTWSDPKQINPEIPDWASQYQPKIVVNNQGIVGIMWFDTRASKQQDQYHLYFSASVDGGKSFLDPVQVSSEPSFPVSKVNLTPSPVSFSADTKSIMTLSAFDRWAPGGDYMGMTADALGIFHPFWADSRSGTFQVWTCRIRVNTEERNEESKEKKISGKKVKTCLNEQIDFIFDPMKYDPETKIVVLPIRLKNVSSDTLFGPFSLKVKSLSAPWIKKNYKEMLHIPQILNASNGETGVGAVFSALRDFESLEPGAISEALKWKLKSSKPASTRLYIEVEVTGFVLEKK
jgi:hypothetical protein